LVPQLPEARKLLEEARHDIVERWTWRSSRPTSVEIFTDCPIAISWVTKRAALLFGFANLIGEMVAAPLSETYVTTEIPPAVLLCRLCATVLVLDQSHEVSVRLWVIRYLFWCALCLSRLDKPAGK
jgi:hypothetical protein